MQTVEDAFKQYGREKEYKKGEVIVKSGSASDHMYFIVSGVVNVSKEVSDKRIIFATFKEGNFFGEMSLISHRKHMSTMEVHEDCKILTLTQKEVEDLLKSDTAFAFGIIQGLIERLRNTDKYLIDAFNMAMEIDKGLALE